jgi:hypothetical protein
MAFLHSFTFFAAAYFLPLYFQATDGASPLMAGVRTLPFSLGGSVTSMFGGILVAKVYRNYRVIMAIALAVMTFGVSYTATLASIGQLTAGIFTVWSDDNAGRPVVHCKAGLPSPYPCAWNGNTFSRAFDCPAVCNAS